ncbi:FecR domain-containing protein [Rouxiella sp. Mn2063]|uniref:FecR domain-containing protein n=1 Tax=Rouxiella sp. Mn2063 TaxID=3395262 RepID=UPI003BBA2F34
MNPRESFPHNNLGIDADSAHAAATWLTLLMSEEVTEHEKVEWQRWRRAKPEHERAWQHIESLSSRFSQLDGSLAHQSLSKLQNPKRRHALKILALLGVGGATGVGIFGTPTARADYRTAIGERKTITLSDGTVVTLNTQSALNVTQNDNRHQLHLLNGEMMVTTGRQRAASTLLNVGLTQGDVSTLGAQFSIRLRDTYSDVAVYQGDVKLRPAISQHIIPLRAGHGVKFSTSGSSNLHSVSTEPGWLRGLLLANNQRLDDFLQELGRYRAGVIRCDSRVANLRLSGVFPLSDTDKILASLTAVLPVRINYFSRYFVSVS